MNECIPVDQLGTLERLSADDPRRRHAASCPRCSSLLFAYQEFMHADERAGANPVAAEMQLARFIATHVEEAPAERVSGTPRRERGRWFDFSMLKFAAVVAASVIVAVSVARWEPWQTKEIVYRGEPAAHFTGVAATAASDGTIELHWDAVKNADAYRVTILSRDLVEIARLAPASQLTARYQVESNQSAPPYYWQVTALQEGAEILTSDPQRLP
jgi:hypothetical protein